MLLEQINQELKQAMKEKKADVVSVLRMLIAAARNKEISLRQKGEASLTDEQITEVIASEIKKRGDAIISYEAGARQDLADKEKKEIAVFEKYLPEQLSDREIERIINDILAELDTGQPQNFGMVMGKTMSRVKGRAGGDRVSQIVKKILAK